MIAIAAVPILIGAGGGRSLAPALVDGYRPAMLVLAGTCVVAALLAAVFVTDERRSVPRYAPPGPHHGCAPPIPELVGAGSKEQSS